MIKSKGGLKTKKIVIKCKKCGREYILGKNAIVVSTAEYGYQNTKETSDLVDSLPRRRSWSTLDLMTIREQEAEIERISNSLRLSISQWWRCHNCNTVQIYCKILKSDKGPTKLPTGKSKGKIKDSSKTSAKIKEKMLRGYGNSSQEAIESVLSRLPFGASDLKQEIINGQKGSMSIKAYSEEEAREEWKRRRPVRAKPERFECIISPTKGFLGVCKKQGSWEVHWSSPFEAKVVFKMVVPFQQIKKKKKKPLKRYESRFFTSKNPPKSFYYSIIFNTVIYNKEFTI